MNIDDVIGITVRAGRQLAVFYGLEFALIAVATLLCIFIAFYNKASNDNHLEVAQLLGESINSGILDEQIESCRECYHPKLFHFAQTLAVKIFSPALREVTIANFLNCICWFLTNLILSSLIREKFNSGKLRLSLFAFCWFNPSVMTVGVQATNDAFVMLFGSVALRFISWPQIRAQLYIWLSTILALFSKGSGLVLLLLVFIRAIAALLINHFGLSIRSRFVILASVVALTAIPFLLPQGLSPYRSFLLSSMTSGNLQELHYAPRPLPPLFTESEFCAQNPYDICSLFDSFFSFRIISLVETPKVPRGLQPVQPEHLRSVWTTVYARYFLPVFPQHFWRDESQLMDQISRILALLGLCPLIFLITGIVRAFNLDLLSKKFWLAYMKGQSLFHLAVTMGLLSMLVIYSLSYHSNSAFKEIYLYCGLFSFWFLFLEGLKFLLFRFKLLSMISTAVFSLISLLWITGLIEIFYVCL